MRLSLPHLNGLHVFTISVVLCAFFFSPSITYAYFTTNQEAIAIDSKSVLFFIDFSFGSKNHEVHIPISARNSTSKSTDAVSYTIYTEQGVKAKGKASGLILNNATEIHEGNYVTKKGQGGKFTLAVVFTPETYSQFEDYYMQVTNLPFSFDGKHQLGLNPSELKYYTTKK